MAAVIVFAGVTLLPKMLRIPFRNAVSALAAGVLAAALFSGLVVDVALERIRSVAGTETVMTGTVTEVRYSSSYAGSYTVKADRDSDTAGGMNVLFNSASGDLRTGDRIRCRVRFDTIDPSGDYSGYMLADGVVLSAEALDETEVIGSETGILIKLSKMRDRLSAKLRSAMSSDSGGFAAALILGDRDHMPDSVTRDFRVLGISHIIALSGTHLSALFAGIGKLIPEGKRRGILRIIVLSPIIIFYMALTGFSSSVVRAGVMFIISLISSAVKKEDDSFTALSVAVFLICIVNPLAPFDVGLQLSFTAVMGLVISDGIRHGTGTKFSRIMKKLIPALVVPAVMLPIMWLRFSEMSLAAPAANLILVPVVSLFIPILGLVILTVPFSALFVPLASAVDRMIAFVLKITGISAKAFDPVLPLAGVITGVMITVFVAVALVAILVTGSSRRILGNAAVILLSVTVLTAQIYATNNHKGMTVCHASKGADDAFCVCSAGNTVLIDVGRYTSATSSAAELGAVNGSGRIDALVLTHLHKSHKQTLADIAGKYYVSTLWIPTPYDEASEGVAVTITDEAEVLGLEVFTYVHGERLTFGECSFTAPSASDVSFSDHPAVNFAFEFDGAEFVYTTSGAEVIPGDVQLVGSHGPLRRGILEDAVGTVLISSHAAGSLDSVPDTASVTDAAVIRFRPDKAPAVEVLSPA